MKNLFKKMMLVAVAAMAFVACSQDNDEINATVKKTDVVFNLSIEDVTRAYFGEEQGSGSDTSFPSYWSGDENVTLVAYDANDVVVSTAWGSIEAEGEQATQARVAATFNDDLAGVAKVRAYVGSWSYDEPRVPELGQEQYMEKEGTVASNAHTMSAEAAWDGVAQSIDLNFSHAVAYGRMQIKGLDDVTITKAIVKVDEAEYQVSLNSELDTKYIWFACDADDAIATLDIEVEASNGRSYVKTIDMAAAANPLKFRTGEVSKFAVSGLTEKPADYTLNLTKVVARTGNTITFQGDEENDKWTVIFNEGLTEIAEGVYQGVYDAAYADAWSSESALEFDSKESSFNLAVNPAQYGYYLQIDSTINVSVEDGIYTITAFWPSYIGGDKTVQISYVGDLTVEESVPTFSTAVKSNLDNDKIVVFSGDAGELKLDFYNCNYDNWIDAGVYNIVNYGSGAGQIYGDADSTQYGYYSVDGAVQNQKAICYGTVTVSVVNGEYHFVFENIGLDAENTYLPYAEFTGDIANITIPDTRTKLAMPNVTYEIEGNMLTLSWDAVDGAVGYYVDDYNHEFEQTTTETSITVELTAYQWWYFYVTAKAAADSTEYKDSDTAYVSFELADPRPVLSAPTNVVVTTDGPNATISWDDVQGADYYLVNYYLNGNQNVEVTENTVTLELGYSQSVWVYIFSKANDDNPDYQSSTSYDCQVQVTTGKNPDVFADYMYENLSWNSMYSRFELTSSTNGITQFYLNSSDAPNNNSIKAGDYSYAGNTVSSPGVGTFSLRYLLGSGAGSSHYVYDATMTVSVENDQYAILITIVNAGNTSMIGKTLGYKGMPDGFVLPDGSAGSGGGDDSGDGDDTGDAGQYGSGTESDPYIYTCSSIKSGGYYRLTFTSQASDAKPLYLESNTDLANMFKSGAINSNNNWYVGACKYANGSITTAWDESTITLTNVSGTIYSFDIKLSTFNGYVYYRCESVNLY